MQLGVVRGALSWGLSRAGLLVLAVGFLCNVTAAGQRFLIRGGTVYDGSGADGQRVDVLIEGKRIVAVGPQLKAKGARVIDAQGLIVCPGFIDLHNHSDEGILKEKVRAALNYLTQGVTTIVTGNCGFGHVNVGEYYRKLARQGVGVNVAHLVPHGSLRLKVVGPHNRPATERELEEMKRLLRKGLEDGAWGMSTGLIYTPGCYAGTDELVELAKVLAEYGALYASHIRGEDRDRLFDALAEAIEVGRRAGVRVHISHLKASGPPAWGLMGRVLETLERARQDGIQVTADQYPYTASSTSVEAMTIPAEAREGGRQALLKRLEDPVEGPKWRAAIREDLARRGGAKTILVASCKGRPEWVGKTLADIAKETGLDPVEVVVEIVRVGGASAVAFTMHEDDVRLAMTKPYVATASDGAARIPDDTLPHPRSYGTFPRKIGRYAIEWHVLPLSQAIRSATGLPADVLGMKDRGYLRPGYVADIVVFDPKRFRDHATFRQPHRYSTGVVWLFVNGRPVIEDGQYNGALAGVPCRRPRD